MRSEHLRELAGQRGLRWRTVQRAKNQAGIPDFRVGYGKGSAVWWGERQH